MALFQVEGWGLENKKVASAPSQASKKKDKNESKAKQNNSKDPANVKENVKYKRERVQFDTKAKERAANAKKDNKNTKNKDKDNNNKRKREEVEEVRPSSKKTEDAPPAATMMAPSSNVKLTPLQQKMMAKLSGSRFRWINEQLYTSTSQEALDLVKKQPSLFDEYHAGFRSQVESWPENPVDVFVKQIKNRASARNVNAPGGLPGLPNSKEVVIADMGCGEAQLAYDVEKFLKDFKNGGGANGKKNFKKQKFDRNGGNRNIDIKVHSFDLRKANDKITVADIKNVPLEDGSCSIVIFCLALMGTNFLDFIKEAYRLLTPRGELWIAEIKSRFTDTKGEEFENALKLLGFFHKSTDNDNKMFTRFEFFKPSKDIIDERIAKLERRQKFIENEDEKEQLEQKRAMRPEGDWLLKPCIYKRR